VRIGGATYTDLQVAYSDNIVTARTFATRRREAIDARQEFLTLGVGNLAAGLFSGFPISSSGSRTVIGDTIGSRTQLYSLVAAAAVLLTTLFLGPALSTFPLAALVIFAALRFDRVGEDRIFPTLPTAVSAYQDWYAAGHGNGPPTTRP
jgi:SulP family sulfate permease